MDFDAVDREITPRPVKFKIGGEMFAADLNVNAGAMLRWMRNGSKVESVPILLDALMGEDESERLEEALDGEPFEALNELTRWLGNQMGDEAGN